MKQDQAEAIALQVLGFIASRDDLIGGFLGASGADVSEIRSRASDPSFLLSVLDYLLQDDNWIISFSEETGLPPTAPGAARAALPGGQEWHWT